jgi:hypothetical protein
MVSFKKNENQIFKCNESINCFLVVSNCFLVVSNCFLVVSNCFLVVSNCLWVVSNCLWVVTNCLWVVTNCLLVVTNCLLVVTNCLLVVSNCLLVVTNCLLVDTNCFLVVTNCLLSTAYFLYFDVGNCCLSTSLCSFVIIRFDDRQLLAERFLLIRRTRRLASMTVYFKHELHEISRNTQKLYETDHKESLIIQDLPNVNGAGLPRVVRLNPKTRGKPRR